MFLCIPLSYQEENNLRETNYKNKDQEKISSKIRFTFINIKRNTISVPIYSINLTHFQILGKKV